MSLPEVPPALVAQLDQDRAAGAETVQGLLEAYREAVTQCGPDLAAGALATVLDADPTYSRRVLANVLAYALRHIDRLG